MADGGYEYEQYAPQKDGPLFSNAMFGFNKEEVLEYLDELADENYQRQDAADRQIQELVQRINALEASGPTAPADNSAVMAELNAAKEQMQQLSEQVGRLDEELEIAKAATQQSEEELAEVKDQLITQQKENSWLRDEAQKNDEEISTLRTQLDAGTSSDSGEWQRELAQAEARAEELKSMLEKSNQELEAITLVHQDLLKNGEAHIGYTDEQLTQTEEQLVQAEEQLTQTEEQLIQTEEQLIQTEEQLTQTEEQLTQTEEQLIHTEEQLTQTESKLTQTEEQLTQIGGKLTQTTEQLTQTEGKLSQTEGQLTLTKGRLVQTEEQLSQLQAQLEDTQLQLDSHVRSQNSSSLKLAAQNQEVTQLRDDLQQAQIKIHELESQKPSQTASAAIIADANVEADRIRAMAVDEKERIRRQIKSSAGGLAESITNLRGDVTGVESDVTQVLESVQTALADILSALSRTEQNLNTLGVQVERFPAASAAVPPPPGVVYFQPGQQVAPQAKPTTRSGRNSKTLQNFGTGSFRQLNSDELPDDSNVRPFKPSYSSGSTTQWPQQTATAEAYAENEDPAEERMRVLAENLVDTLVQMMN